MKSTLLQLTVTVASDIFFSASMDDGDEDESMNQQKVIMEAGKSIDIIQS